MVTTVIFRKVFSHLKAAQPAVCFWVNMINMFLSPQWIFILSQQGFFASLMENLLPSTSTKIYRKLDIFLGELSSRQQASEQMCIPSTFLPSLLSIVAILKLSRKHRSNKHWRRHCDDLINTDVVIFVIISYCGNHFFAF